MAARFDHMRANADRLAPDPAGILKDHRAFFRRGSSGAAREILTDEDIEGLFAETEGKTSKFEPLAKRDRIFRKA